MTSGADEPGRLVILAGRLDASTVSACRDAVNSALDLGAGPLVIELSGVHTIDATGLGMLIGAQRRAHRAGRSVLLRGVPPRVTRLLRATHLDRVLLAEPAHVAGVGV